MGSSARDPMPFRIYPVLAVISLSTSLLMAGGCTERTAEEPRAESVGRKQAGTPVNGTSHPGAPRNYLSWAADEMDTSNRYLPAVSVTAHPSLAEGGEVECSGVLMGPRLVLTAGRCVCTLPKTPQAREKGSSSLIDASSCAAEATVTAVVYETPAAGEDFSYVSKEYRGTVHPHPELELRVDPQQVIISSHSDLAVILLGKPVKNVTPFKLAATGAEAAEWVTVVGYARDETRGGMGRKRHHSQGKVAKISQTGAGSFLLELDLRERLAPSDTGGPCLRDTGQGPMLIGILSGASDGGVACTSVYSHRTWLNEELQRAAPADKGPPQETP
ncbi:MAG TPA: trypsin-like serine protease [Hyalangium sp.]|nr:trypsin-like serine protease [Hyalangium sp.]